MWLSLTEKNLVEMVNYYSWIGKGTKEDPYIIRNLNIEDYGIKHLILKKCQNIRIHNCQIKYIHFIKCKNITITECKFNNFGPRGSFRLCSNISIKNNLIKKINPQFCRALIITDNIIGRKSLKKIKKDKNNIMNFFFSYKIIFLIFFIIWILFLGLLISISNAWYDISFNVFGFIFISILFSLELIFLIIFSINCKNSYLKMMKDLPSNIIENNKIFKN